MYKMYNFLVLYQFRVIKFINDSITQENVRSTNKIFDHWSGVWAKKYCKKKSL